MKDASYYDTVYSGKYRVDKERVREVAKYCKGRVLDVGCGDGALAGEWKGEYIGVDFSPKAVDIAQQRHPTREFIVRDVLKHPLPKGPWDTIVLGEVLEHLTEEAGNYLLVRCTEVLAGDGRIIISVPNGGRISDPAHISIFTEADLVSILFPHKASVYSFGKNLIAVIDRNYPKLSVAIIARDEADLLPRCLESLQYGSKPHPTKPDLTIPDYLWDELVVVVDTRTTDETAQIAKSFGAKVYPYGWETENRSAPRNFAESKCTGKYIFWQDADEILEEGHTLIKEIVEKGEREGVKPYMRLTTGLGYARQELLHKNNGQWRWEGELHPYLCGPTSQLEKGIVQLHLPRAIDRPHPDPIGALYANLGTSFKERHLFYLLREYRYAKRYQTAIALVDLMLKQPVRWPIQRSHSCIIKGDCYGNLVDKEKQILAYLDAIQEWPNWAEPYYALGKAYYEQKNWTLGASWLYASLPHKPPPEYFTELNIYEWMRYDLLAVCLHRLGDNTKAIQYGQIALDARPDDPRLRKNMEYYRKALGEADSIPLFSSLCIETQSYCNRKCKTCLRQTYPERSALSGRWPAYDISDNWLPENIVHRLIDEAADMGFTGSVCLQYFNEPLFDPRIGDFAKYAKSKGVFSEVYANTNGDMLDEELAKKLDGAFDRLHISLYGKNKEKRRKKFSSWFKQTKLTWANDHVVTHYSSFSNLQECISTNLERPCLFEVRNRMIISYTGEMLLCCEDIGGRWNLGNVKDSSLKDLWFSDKHVEILKILSLPRSREKYPYCRECPRQG